MTGIYKITNPKGKIYIGQSVDINRRKSCYKNQYENQIGKRIYNSINKYGWENHIFEVIKECSVMELNEMEIYYINHFNCILEGLNIKEGGSHGKHNDTTKQIIRLKATGRKLSTEAKQKISDSKQGNKYNLGRKHNDETKQKHRLRSTGRKKSPEEIEKIRQKNSKAILQLDMRGEFITLWESTAIASKELNINKVAICNCLTGKSKSSGGYKWEYKI